tara:strand:- start:11045 stop:13129 length:2085 start_codon:yes stop_codon:yes gene_type:complete
MENSKILHNSLNFFKRRIAELTGFFLVIISALFIFSLSKYSPESPSFILNSDKLDFTDYFGSLSNAISDIFLQSFGLVSFVIGISVLLWGINLILEKKINKFINKFFYTILYISIGCLLVYIVNNNSFWLIHYGNAGFVGEKSFGLIYKYVPLIEKDFSKIILIILFSFFFILSSGINIKKIIIKIFSLLGKIFSKKVTAKEKIDSVSSDYSVQKDQENLNLNKQQSFSFQKVIEEKSQDYKLPSVGLLGKKANIINNNSNFKLPSADFIEKILLDFGIKGKIKKVNNGPVVSLYEFEPAPGVKVSKIINLSDDIARNTSSTSARVSPIPGKNTVGIEIPNPKRESVILSEIISSENFQKKEIGLPITLGKSISGVPLVADLSTMPHLLVAGTTGSGKSVCINSIILSLLYRHSPDTCKLILIDPKMLELSSYEGIPHLLTPVITDSGKATSALSWTVKEMENRYKLMSSEGVRNIDGYNQKHKLKMPYIVVAVDEMSDLMLVSGKEIESYVQKLSAMARAAGIHIIMATQRPSVDVITGTIKANFPTRISFQVSSKIDSKTILGEQGAEQLLGKGDMLFMSSANKIFRIHGTYVSENEIEKVTSYIRAQGNPDYIQDIVTKKSGMTDDLLSGGEEDELYQTALQIIKTEKKASTSFLQRKLQIGYNRAARIIEKMEEDGLVSQANHVGKREVL